MNLCGICFKSFVVNDAAIRCVSHCSRYFHRQCVGLNEKDYDRIIRGNVKWACERADCVVPVVDFVESVNQRMSEVSKKIDDIKKDQSDFKIILKYMFTGLEKMKCDIDTIQTDPNRCSVESHLNPLLVGTEKETAVTKLAATGWNIHSDKDALYKEFSFSDFSEAFSFMTRIALVAEKMGHHPEWSNVHNKVHITLTSHDVNGISRRDVKLASYCDQFAEAVVLTRFSSKNSALTSCLDYSSQADENVSITEQFGWQVQKFMQQPTFTSALDSNILYKSTEKPEENLFE